MYIKRALTLIFYWELSKNFWGSYFFNTQIDGCFWKRTVFLEKMLWYDKNKEPLKTCVTQERVEGNLTKKVTKSDIGGRVTDKKSDTIHSKKLDFASDVLFEWPLWCWLILLFFMSVLLMMLLACYETNKPYISK